MRHPKRKSILNIERVIVVVDGSDGMFCVCYENAEGWLGWLSWGGVPSVERGHIMFKYMCWNYGWALQNSQTGSHDSAIASD